MHVEGEPLCLHNVPGLMQGRPPGPGLHRCAGCTASKVGQVPVLHCVVDADPVSRRVFVIEPDVPGDWVTDGHESRAVCRSTRQTNICPFPDRFDGPRALREVKDPSLVGPPMIWISDDGFVVGGVQVHYVAGLDIHDHVRLI